MRTKQSATTVETKPNHPTLITWCDSCHRAGVRFDGDAVDSECRYCGGTVYRRRYETLGAARRAVEARQLLNPAIFSRRADDDAEDVAGAELMTALMTARVSTARPD